MAQFVGERNSLQDEQVIVRETEEELRAKLRSQRGNEPSDLNKELERIKSHIPTDYENKRIPRPASVTAPPPPSSSSSSSSSSS
eukprot:EC785517.1.p1 GENE.EC785517.1~~EC785517.1.p1  ORF type:complete len:93 (+),score=35.67 EC785517.1:30-281(+)